MVIDLTLGVDEVRREASSTTAPNARSTPDSGRFTEVLSSDDNRKRQQTWPRAQGGSSRPQKTPGWLAKLISQAVLPSAEPNLALQPSPQGSRTGQQDRQGTRSPTRLDLEDVQGSDRPSSGRGRSARREQSRQPSLFGSATRAPSLSSRIGTPQTDRGGGLDQALLHEIIVREREGLPSEQANNHLNQWIPQTAGIRPSSLTGVWSETATRNSFTEPPGQIHEGQTQEGQADSLERTLRLSREETQDDWLDSAKDDDTDASEVQGISVNDMLASRRPGRRPQLLSQSILRQPDPSYWAERQERELEVLNHMRRNLSPTGQSEDLITHRQRRHHRKWTKREVKRLLKLWFLHGNAWSQIKAIDTRSSLPQLSNRSQVDLKDKLRTIKAWMLR